MGNELSMHAAEYHYAHLYSQPPNKPQSVLMESSAKIWALV
jgi:hypothetical protein